MDVEKQIEAIWSILHAMAERENQMEKRHEAWFRQAKERADRADARMDRAEARMDRAEARTESIERSVVGIRKLLVIGAKEMVKIRQETRDLKRAQKAFLDYYRGPNGRNGNKRA